MKFASIAVLSALLINTLTLTAGYSQNPPPPSNPPSVNAEGKPTFWRWESEQEWIIDSIGKDIAEMLVYAKYHSDPAIKVSASSLKFQTTTVDKKANKYKFELVLPSTSEAVSHEFTINGYVWSPATYQPFVKQLMEALNLKADPTSSTPDNYLKILAGADMGQLFSENERISKALSETPLDPCLHEQAALLQATFDMLELAGNLSDTRAPLNRISAHLAIAENIAGSDHLTLVGNIADIALESMSCRDGIAVEKCDNLAKSQADDETAKSWLRALKIRSSGDYRLFDEKKQTPLEASQFGLRYANFLTADKTLNYIHAHKCTPKLRWMRIATCSQPSVASGHEVDSQLFPTELNAFADDYKLYNKQTLDLHSLVSELNKTSTRCLINENGTPKLIVLSWGDVAAYHARHILSAVTQAYNFYEYWYGVKEMADSTIKDATNLLGGMTLFPVALQDVKDDHEHKETNDKFYAGMEKLFVEHPELVVADTWIHTKESAKKSNPPGVIRTQPELWFSPPYPIGTAYYFLHRKSLDTCKPDLAELTRLRELCPLDTGITWSWITKKYGEHPTGDQMREGFGKSVDYDLQAMRYCAQGDIDNPAKYEAVMQKISAFNPDDYFVLAYFMVQHKQPEKAAKYYEEGRNKAQDSVLAANSSTWLVNYYYDKGEKQKALEIAKDAADVYSMAGLCCLADLYDRMGELAKAEQLYIDANERYSKNYPLIGFYVRHADKNKKYADEAARLLKKDFPNGLKRIELSSLAAPPKLGVKVTYCDPLAQSLGLQTGSIIVGINGYKTDNETQFNIARKTTLNPNLKTTYFDRVKYKEVVVPTVMRNELGISVEDYTEQK